jgi:hypothetical protein
LLDKFEKEIIKQTQRDLQNLHVAWFTPQELQLKAQEWRKEAAGNIVTITEEIALRWWLSWWCARQLKK